MMILQRAWLSWVILMMPPRPHWGNAEFGSDTILQGQEMRDGEVLTSSNNLFKLQFFSIGGASSSSDRYLGIFFLNSDAAADGDGDPVWIANRDFPIPAGNNYTSLTLTNSATDGRLSIDSKYPDDTRGGSFVITNISHTAGYRGNVNTSATLGDDGNLVLSGAFPDGSSIREVLWQSFDYPTDTLLPGMQLGFEPGHSWLLTSWSDDQIPTSGSFTLGMSNRNNTNELIIWWHKKIFWSSGLWRNDNHTFQNLAHTASGGSTNLKFNDISIGSKKYLYILDYSQTNDSRALRLTPQGNLILMNPKEELISCYDDVMFYHGGAGCIDQGSTICMNGPYPDNSWTLDSKYLLNPFYSIKEEYTNLNMIDCKAKCVQNCSCVAYAPLYANGTGCQFWDRDSWNLTGHAFNRVDKAYIRSQFAKGQVVDAQGTATANKSWLWLVFVVCGTLLLVSRMFCIRFFSRSKVKLLDTDILMLQELADTSNTARKHTKADETNQQKSKNMSQVHQFKYETIEIATNKFSAENKLGQGGFGPVYKGKLGRKDIAVKKLSRNSCQGVREFENEVQLIVKLQHKNLVRLSGCCIHREEMMLVYEYMPNKSLDFFLFDPSRRALLNWTSREKIIEGISQGLLYLHKHSRLKVIHRDLKAGNILLDENMIPKISDFGLARICGTRDSEVNTKRIVGTRGYMSPEYAIKGIVSTKTDVFSFGVLVLEIVSGKKNHSSYHSERPLNLIGLAWELWSEGCASDLFDTTLDTTNHENEILRCINVGLLCVQDSATDRPSMTDVIFMLKNESLQLPTPKKPAFFIETNTKDEEIEESQPRNCSNNNMSTSVMEAR